MHGAWYKYAYCGSDRLAVSTNIWIVRLDLWKYLTAHAVSAHDTLSQMLRIDRSTNEAKSKLDRCITCTTVQDKMARGPKRKGGHRWINSHILRLLYDTGTSPLKYRQLFSYTQDDIVDNLYIRIEGFSSLLYFGPLHQSQRSSRHPSLRACWKRSDLRDDNVHLRTASKTNGVFWYD